MIDEVEVMTTMMSVTSKEVADVRNQSVATATEDVD